MSAFVTDVELAADMGLPLDTFHRLRLRNHWPHIKLGRKEVRFTAEQVAEIVALHSVVASPKPVSVAVKGQTARSASRRRS